MLATPGMLRKLMMRGLYLATSSTAKPPHRDKGHCLLFIINTYAAVTSTGSPDELQPPCAKQKAHLSPKLLFRVYVWDVHGVASGTKVGTRWQCCPVWCTLAPSPASSGLSSATCAKGRGRAAGSVFKNVALLSLSEFLYFFFSIQCRAA